MFSGIMNYHGMAWINIEMIVISHTQQSNLAAWKIPYIPHVDLLHYFIVPISNSIDFPLIFPPSLTENPPFLSIWTRLSHGFHPPFLRRPSILSPCIARSPCSPWGPWGWRLRARALETWEFIGKCRIFLW